MIVFLMTWVGCALISGFDRTSNSLTGRAGKPVIIGVSMKTQAQMRWRFDVASMEERVRKIGARLIVQWANDDPLRQHAQVENLISQGIDALIAVPVDDRSARSFVREAKRSGIPVIAYDIAIPDSEVDCFVTRDNRLTARLHVQGALAFSPPDSSNPPNYGLIKGDPSSNVAREFAEEYVRILKPLVLEGKIRIVVDQWQRNWSAEEALRTAENALAANKDNIQAFITSADGMAIGVAQAVQARNLAGKVYISGTDADPAVDRLIVRGIVNCSVWTRLDQMGRQAVDVAVAIARKESFRADGTVKNGSKEVPAVFVEIQVVTKENMCNWIQRVAPAGWVSIEKVYADLPIPTECQPNQE